MLDENQSLRINFKKFVGTVQVFALWNLLYMKKQKKRFEKGATREMDSMIYNLCDYLAKNYLHAKILEELPKNCLVDNFDFHQIEKKTILHLIYPQGALLDPSQSSKGFVQMSSPNAS